MRNPVGAFITSPDGGLAHYVLHLWEHVTPWAEPLFLTGRNGRLDDLVIEHVPSVVRCIDHEDPSSVERIAALAADRGIRWINLHVGTSARRQAVYLERVLSRLRRRGIAVILTLHDVVPYATIAVDEAGTDRLFAQADGFVVGNATELERLSALIPGDDRPVAVAHHGPYELLGRTACTRAAARRALDIEDDVPVVLSFGAWRPDKGLETLIDAHRLVRDRQPRAMLLMHAWFRHGDLGMFEELAARAASTAGVRFSDEYLPAAEVTSFFAAADVVVLPYEHVSQSGVLHLAGALDKPVVVTDAFPDADVIEPWPGRLAAAGSSSSLAEAILGLLSIDPGEASARAREGWARAHAGRGWRDNAAALRELVARVQGRGLMTSSG